MRHPLHQQENLASNKERSKDELVVPGQPQRQVDVEIVGALFGIGRSQIRQRATASVYAQGQALGENHSAENRCNSEVLDFRRNGDGHNASDKTQLGYRM